MWTRDKRQEKLGGTYRCVDNIQLGGKDRCVDRIHEIFKRYIKVVRQDTVGRSRHIRGQWEGSGRSWDSKQKTVGEVIIGF